MATFKDLCSNVPSQLSRQAAQYELLRRQATGYLQRMGALCAEERVFDRCQAQRPQAGKYRNRASSEEAGSIGSCIVTRRTQGSHIHVACKAKKF